MMVMWKWTQQHRDNGFDCMNLAVDDPHQKTFFLNKPIAASYIIVKIQIIET